MQKVRTWSPYLLGAVDQLGLVHHVGDVLKDGGGQLHPHADVHLVVEQLQSRPMHCSENHSAPERPGAAMSRLQATSSPLPRVRRKPPSPSWAMCSTAVLKRNSSLSFRPS